MRYLMDILVGREDSHKKKGRLGEVLFMRLTNKQLFRLASLLLVLILVVAIVIFYNLNKVAINNELVNLDLLPKPEKLTELYFNNSADLPGSSTGGLLTGTYTGAIADVSSHVKTRLSLIRVQQNQGKITGYLTLGTGLQGSGPFIGTIDAAKHIRLTVRNPAGYPGIFFEGTMQSATSLSGDFYRCSPNSTQSGLCNRASKGNGTWNLARAVSFTFVIHNLEAADYRYAYEVYVDADGTRHTADSGNVLVKDSQYFVKNEEFNLVNSSGRQEVVVDLIDLHQSIDFWIGGN